MKRKLLLLMLLLLLPQLALAEEVAVAYIETNPSPVRENQPFEIVLGGFFPSAAPPAPVVRFEAGRIILILPDEQDGPLINVPWGERVRIEGLPAGRYDVIVRGLGRAELAGLTLHVRPAPFSISPSFGPAGSEVLIEGVLLPVCDTDPCVTPVVLFGGRRSPSVRITAEGDLVAVVPDDVEAVVPFNVTVRTANSEVTLPYGFTGAFPLNEAGYERVLLPLAFQGPGAHGSNWITKIVVRNDAPIAVPVDSLISARPLPSGERALVPPNADRGLILELPRGLLKWLTWSSHIIDLSRTATNRGTEIPVVREEDTAPVIRLLSVPLTSRFRAHLRVYWLDPTEERAPQKVTVLVKKGDGTTVTLSVPLEWHPTNCITGDCPERPAFGIVDLSADPRLANAGEVDLTIYGSTNDQRLWAFVSVANNETQRVTLWTPQHDNKTAGVAR